MVNGNETAEGGEEIGGEELVSVRDDDLRDAMEADYLPTKEFCSAFCGKCDCCRREMNHLRQFVLEDENAVVAFGGLGQSSDKITGDGVPWVVRYLPLAEERLPGLSVGLYRLADVAFLDKISYVLANAWPPHPSGEHM